MPGQQSDRNVVRRFEEIPPSVVPFEIVKDGESLQLQPKSGADGVALPLTCLPYILHFKTGGSVQAYIEIHRRQPTPIQFRLLFQTLDSLYLGGMLRNSKEFSSHLDGLRDEYRWSEPSLKEEFLGTDLSDPVRVGRHSSILAVFVALGMILVGLRFLPYLTQLRFDGGFLIEDGSFWRGWFMAVLLTSTVLSLKVVLSSLFKSFFSGWLPAFRLRLSPIGPLIEAESGGRARVPPGLPSLICVAASALALFIALPLIQLLPVSDSTRPDLLFIVLLIGLLEGSPFSRSDLTSLLMSFYNMRPSTGEPGRGWERHREFVIHTLHVLAIAGWLILFGVWVALFLPSVIQDFKTVWGTGLALSRLSALVAGLWVLTWIGGLLVEVFTSFSYLGPRTSFRRFWLARRDERALLSQSEVQNIEPYQVLSELPPFNQLDEDVLRNISSQSRLQTVPVGTFLCRQGDLNRDMFLVLSGRVGVFKSGRLGRYTKVLEMDRGAVFGEVGFFSGGRRTADVRAIEETQVLRIVFNPTGGAFALDGKRFQVLQDRIWLMQTLMTAPLFRDLPFEALEVFVRFGKITNVAEGQVLIREGDRGGGFHVLIQGAARVLQKGQLIREMQRGDVFGEIAILRNTPRTATVTASGECKILTVDVEEFWHILGQNLSLALLFEKVAFQRLARDRST